MEAGDNVVVSSQGSATTKNGNPLQKNMTLVNSLMMILVKG